jgi:hypothetical protein
VGAATTLFGSGVAGARFTALQRNNDVVAARVRLFTTGTTSTATAAERGLVTGSM